MMLCAAVMLVFITEWYSVALLLLLLLLSVRSGLTLV